MILNYCQVSNPLSLVRILIVHLCLATSSFLSSANEIQCAIDTAEASSRRDHRLREQVIEQILAENYTALDQTLPTSIHTLQLRGAHRCWHKHSTFLQHLLHVHHILRLWGVSDDDADDDHTNRNINDDGNDEKESDVVPSVILARVGLFHSAYSNSYVNLALFQPMDPNERSLLQTIIGEDAEELVYLFCTINRQDVVVNTLWRKGFIPEDGLWVDRLQRDDDNEQQKEKIFLSEETLRILTIFTMADVADQYFGWQDQLFNNVDGNTNHDDQYYSMLFPGENEDISKHDSTALWPGQSKPGLWMSFVSQLGSILTSSAAELSTDDEIVNPSNDAMVKIPPVFQNCTKILSREDERIARDLYWSVVTGTTACAKTPNDDSSSDHQTVINTLQKTIRHNPYIFEPYVMLAQKYLHINERVKAQESAKVALELQFMWGTPYDKRMSFEAWVAWTRVLYQRALSMEGEEEALWPVNSWEVNNLGLVY